MEYLRWGCIRLWKSCLSDGAEGISFDRNCQRFLTPLLLFKFFSKETPEASGVIVTKERRESCSWLFRGLAAASLVALVALLRSRKLSAMLRRVAWAARPAPRGQEQGDAVRQQGSLSRHLYRETFLVVFKCHSLWPRREPYSDRGLWDLRRPLLRELAVGRQPGSRGARSGRYARIPAVPSPRVVARSGPGPWMVSMGQDWERRHMH